MKRLLTSNGKLDRKCGRRSSERKLFTMATATVIVSGAWLKRTNLDMVDLAGAVEEESIRSGFSSCFSVVLFLAFTVLYHRCHVRVVRYVCYSHVIHTRQWYVHLNNLYSRLTNMNYYLCVCVCVSTIN